MKSVFICYRRASTAGEAHLLRKDLIPLLGTEKVFMDVDSIAPGRDFRDVLQSRLATCDVMLVLIGRNWLEPSTEPNQPRLHEPADYVHQEIAAALERNILVTPVLVQDAELPKADKLPDELNALAFRQTFELRHERWDSDARELIERLGLARSGKAESEIEARPAKPNLIKHTPHKEAVAPTGPSKSGSIIFAAIFGVVFVLLAGAGLYYWPDFFSKKISRQVQITITDIRDGLFSNNRKVLSTQYAKRIDEGDERLASQLIRALIDGDPVREYRVNLYIAATLGKTKGWSASPTLIIRLKQQTKSQNYKDATFKQNLDEALKKAGHAPDNP